MARIAPKEIKEYPWYIRWVLRSQKKKYGHMMEPILLWGRTPRVFRKFFAIIRAFNRKSSPIDSQLRSLIMTKVAMTNHCSFCVDMNSYMFFKERGEERKIAALMDFEGSEEFSEKEKVVLEYTESITITSETISDELFNRLKSHFSDDAIVELTAIIAFQNMSSKFNSALDANSFGFCKRP